MATTVTLYRDDNYGQPSTTLTTSDPNLKNNIMGGGPTWNDQVSSIEVSGGSAWFYGNVDDNNGPFITQNPFQDWSAQLGTGKYDLAPGGSQYTNVQNLVHNDELSSLDIPAGVTVKLFQDIDSKGAEIDFHGPAQINLTDFQMLLTWDKQVSSITISGGGYVKLYSEPNYNGGTALGETEPYNALTIRSDTRSLNSYVASSTSGIVPITTWNDHASSIKLFDQNNNML